MQVAFPHSRAREFVSTGGIPSAFVSHERLRVQRYYAPRIFVIRLFSPSSTRPIAFPSGSRLWWNPGYIISRLPCNSRQGSANWRFNFHSFSSFCSRFLSKSRSNVQRCRANTTSTKRNEIHWTADENMLFYKFSPAFHFVQLLGTRPVSPSRISQT